MSLIACDRCGEMIDSDADPYCFVDEEWMGRKLSEVMCENCREHAWIRLQDRLLEDGA